MRMVPSSARSSCWRFAAGESLFFGELSSLALMVFCRASQDVFDLRRYSKESRCIMLVCTRRRLTMRSFDALSSFSAFAKSVLYCSSSGLSGLTTGAALSFPEVIGGSALAIEMAEGVATSAMLSVVLNSCKAKML